MGGKHKNISKVTKQKTKYEVTRITQKHHTDSDCR